jgi:O-antigen/teichoic acid export membrane protein
VTAIPVRSRVGIDGLGRKSLLALGGDLVNAALGLVAMYFVARHLGPVVVGTLGYFLALLGALSFAADLGLHQAFRKRASEDLDETGAYLVAFAALKGALTIALAGVFALVPLVDPRLAERLAAGEGGAYAVIALFYMASSLLAVPSLTFAARRETARLTLLAIGGSAVSNLAKIAVALAGLGITALAAAYALQTVVALLLGVALLRGLPLRWPSARHARRLLTYATPVIAVTGLFYLGQHLDRVLLERLAGAREVGYYAAVGGVVAILQRVPLAAVNLFFPQASEDARAGALVEVARRLAVVERYGLMLTVPLAAAVAALSDVVVAIVLGDGFAPSAGVLAILALNPVLIALFEPYNTVVYAVERHGRLVAVSVLHVATLVVVAVALVPGLGAAGAAVASVVAQAASGACQVAIAVRVARMRLYRGAAAHVGAGLAMFATVVLVRAAAPPGLVGAGLALPAGLGVFCALLGASGQLTGADVRRFLDLLNPAKMAAYVASEVRGRHEAGRVTRRDGER